MDTTGMVIALSPVNLTNALGLDDGLIHFYEYRDYSIQNVANAGGAVLYLAVVDGSNPDPVRGSPAEEIHLNERLRVRQVGGGTGNIWVWCGVEGGRVVVSDANIIDFS